MTNKRRKSASKADLDTKCANCGVRHRTLTLEECLDRSMSESTLQDRIVGRAKRRGWTVAHAGKGWVGDAEAGTGQFITPMMPGWPDLFLLNPKARGPKAMAFELKREQGEVDEKQWEVIHLLNACGIPTVVIRPSDLREGRVTAILTGV